MTARTNRTNPASARDVVEAILGNGPSSAGRAITNFVDDTVVSLREEVDTRISELVERIRSTDGLAAEQTRLSSALTALASHVDTKASAADVAAVRNDVRSLRNTVAAAGRLLAEAMEATNVAATAPTPAAAAVSVGQAENLTDQVEAAQCTCAERLEALENRVAELERWRTQVVEPALDAHREMLDEHEGRIAALESSSETEDQPEPVAPVAPVQPVHTVSNFQRRVHPRNWGWLAWLLAVVGGFIALLIAMAWLGPAILGWLGTYPDIVKGGLAFVAGAALTSVGFFGGGLLGATIADNQASDVEQSTTVVVTTS